MDTDYQYLLSCDDSQNFKRIKKIRIPPYIRRNLEVSESEVWSAEDK